ncbi:unnamed protein product [Effrenium voratum]|uniref:Uncharacterized protein n=1 Tax=Effrenium voratum TaxID=2562239 RepID=A0AA36MS05_9DINO|nr:unnamed protein product [Effrenium voratum]
MAVATTGMLPQERVAANFTLHRSETVAHSAGLLDRKNSAASTRARGRSEGFACKHSDAFRPLGAPVPPERVTEMNNSTLGKVSKMQAAIDRDASTFHQDKMDKEKSRRKEAEMRRELDKLQKELMDRPTSPDGKDGKDEQGEEGSLEAEREEMQGLGKLPHALYGKDLPRCGQAQERQEKDGFKSLKLHIKDSFRRVEQVKSDADAAFEACAGTFGGFQESGSVRT